MTGETERSPSGWTIDTLKVLSDEREHHAEERATWMDRWLGERDRRYKEIAEEREKALAIKEKADEKALGLQSQNQQYRDEKGNELRSQIERERGSYATKDDLAASVAKLEVAMKPLSDFVTLQQGRQAGIGMSAGAAIAVIIAVGGLVGIVTTILLATQ